MKNQQHRSKRTIVVFFGKLLLVVLGVVLVAVVFGSYYSSSSIAKLSNCSDVDQMIILDELSCVVFDLLFVESYKGIKNPRDSFPKNAQEKYSTVLIHDTKAC